MTEVILHIGLTKTGSSSIQAFLESRRQDLLAAGYLYPLAGRGGSQGADAHHNLFYELSDGRRGNGTFDPVRGGWSHVVSELSQSSCSTGIISSEAFQYCDESEILRVRHALQRVDIRVVAYVRRHDRWLESAWNQRARFGRASLRFDDFYRSEGLALADFAQVIAPWIDIIGDENVDVRNYDRAVAGDGVIDDFAGAYIGRLGRPTSTAGLPRRNSKAGLKHLLAVARVHEGCRRALGPDFTLPPRSATRISEYFRSREDIFDFTVLSFHESIEIAKYFQEADETLMQISSSFRAAGPLDRPRPEEFQGHVDPSALTDDIFSADEQRFVQRMTREIIRATTRSLREDA